MKTLKFAVISAAALVFAALTFTSCGGMDADGSNDGGNETSTEAINENVMTETSNDKKYGELTAKRGEWTSADGVYGSAAPSDADNTALFTAEMTEGFRADVTVTVGDNGGEAGILFNASDSEYFDGVEGYYLAVSSGYVRLYDACGSQYSGQRYNEIDCKRLPAEEKTFTLRVESDGKLCRCYYLDDMEGVEPWWEFEYQLTEHKGGSLGLRDTKGAVYASLSVTPFTPEAAPSPAYINPIIDDLADPCVIKYDGLYYLYSTHMNVGYDCYTSPDLVNWTNIGTVLESAWRQDRWYWAPEVIERNGKFYMICSVNEKLGIAVADSPAGPFIPERHYIFAGAIDGHFFIDDDGQAYLYYVNWREGMTYAIYGMKLNDDMVTPDYSSEKLLFIADKPWETVGGAVAEGPYMLKHNGKYYLTYSGTGYTSQDYAVGYAISDSPLGDYEKYAGNPVLSKSAKLVGTGHHSFTTSPDGSELIIVYHVHRSLESVQVRRICIDRARFAPTPSGVDRLEILGPTHLGQEYPK